MKPAASRAEPAQHVQVLEHARRVCEADNVAEHAQSALGRRPFCQHGASSCLGVPPRFKIVLRLIYTRS
eukprot:scaffold56533_cov63-Phaeocystis_antarctica.AAC.2